MEKIIKRNILGQELKSCCKKPMTGFFRDGFCRTGNTDHGVHVVCVVITEKFLNFTQSCGNDLSAPNSSYGFPGLKPGDKWCLCASRWKEAWKAGVAPLVDIEATHEKALEIIEKELLLKYRVK